MKQKSTYAIHLSKHRSNIKEINYSLEELYRGMVVAELPGCLEPSLLAPVEEKTEQQKLASKYIYICQTRNNFTDPWSNYALHRLLA